MPLLCTILERFREFINTRFDKKMKRQSLLILISLIFSISIDCQVHKQAKNMDLKVVRDFIESINSANIDRIYNLMSNDHVFIDSQGNKMIGNENMKKAWSGYFGLFPDYKIEITDTLKNDSMIVLLGYASGTYNTNKKSSDNNNHWRIPASWKAIVIDGKIKHWQVYADNSVVIDIINKNK
jgi:ketosteroid isomerase-like protein